MHTRTGRNDITLPPDCDFTTIYDDSSSSFILQADHRNDSSPFFGYFPLRQCAGPGDNGHSMVLIHSNVGKIEDLMQSDVWKATLPDVPENERSFLVESRDGKGMAMIARRDIDAGELIFKERPIYVSAKTKDIMPDQSLKTGFFHRSAARRLGKKQRAALLSLSNCHPPEEMDELPGKLATNYLPVDLTDRPSETQEYCAAFPTLSRANHSCGPNANYFFHYPDFTGRMYASVPIRAGEEISILYTDPLAPAHTRRDALLSGYRFVCACAFCAHGTVAEKRASDSRRGALRALLVELGALPPRVVPLHKLQNGLEIAEQEHLWHYRTQIRHLGGASLLLAAQHAGVGTRESFKCMKVAVEWLELARVGYRNMEGPDAYHVKELDALLG